MHTTARIFKALGDETRLRILGLLTCGERCVCDLMTVLELPQSTVSSHRATLRNVGWVAGRRQGLWMYYRLAGEESPLQHKALALLRRELAASPHGERDQESLAAYLVTKSEAA